MTNRREQTLVRAISACLTGDLIVCEEVFTHDVVCTSPVLAASSLDELETLLSGRRDSLVNVELSTVRLFEVDGSAAAEWHAAADHTQPFVIPGDTGFRANQKRVSLSGASFADFQGSRISSLRNYFDQAGLLEQLLAD